ncbi:hypothetical protein BHM03_00055675 [Ensete ventricosum]|nr:hypothetical protein BHM03_00055675 [Ensete ventricosum]
MDSMLENSVATHCDFHSSGRWRLDSVWESKRGLQSISSCSATHEKVVVVVVVKPVASCAGSRCSCRRDFLVQVGEMLGLNHGPNCVYMVRSTKLISRIRDPNSFRRMVDN